MDDESRSVTSTVNRSRSSFCHCWRSPAGVTIEEMRVGPTLEKLADDEAGLHRLPKADFVGDEHA